MKYNRDILEIIFYARGGQGAKTAAEIIAQAAVKEGRFVQAFPQFGPERSGAPTKTFVRISSSPIRTHEPVTDPDMAVVLDETILDSENVMENLSRNESMIVNSEKTAEELRCKINSRGADYEGKIHPVDANGISVAIIGQLRPNTVILGKIIQIAEIARIESVISEFRKIFERKIGREATKKNVQAIEKAYDIIS
ncbi:MAG: 2-oxoacid:acceptor oxidoreductase family protein [Candidatus Moranbacteria bacterium]|nr:2-oxoacid:acceptor oxidoreductase family protein [Candidatus Moranbacteria bacterium]